MTPDQVNPLKIEMVDFQEYNHIRILDYLTDMYSKANYPIINICKISPATMDGLTFFLSRRAIGSFPGLAGHFWETDLSTSLILGSNEVLRKSIIFMIPGVKWWLRLRFCHFLQLAVNFVILFRCCPTDFF